MLINLSSFVPASETTMSRSAACGPVERLDKILTDLEVVCGDLRGNEQQLLVEKIKQDVVKLHCSVKRYQVEQVVKLVQDKEWPKAIDQMKKYFPGDISIGFVEEVMALVYVSNSLDNLTSAIKWAGYLDTELKYKAYETLYEKIKFKGLTDRPQTLLLRSRVKRLPVGVLDDIRSQLDCDASAELSTKLPLASGKRTIR